uniref:HAUS augmin-like complex subunit 6 N-terminal domain-containing protein n=1 Tax=Myripristis murdjan TaxID=586833 RepID=A0A667ZL99_9TELE
MEGTVPLLKSNGKYLWFALLGLGFQPDAATSLVTGRANVKQLNFGTTMFEKPNKDAFHIVIHFLLNKLNPTRFQEVYRHCWPVLNHKADAEFRKVTCAWLREIMDENGSAGSKVVASLFLSPGGPKFINVMLQLANHVMLQEMKTFTTNGSWVPETAATSVSKDMLWKRTKLMRTRFLKVAVDQDNLLQEYQRRAQSLVKSSKDIRAEGAKYDDLLKYVRYLWSVFDGMLSTIKEEQKVVDCVVNGEVDQHTLDGTDLVLKIPQTLLERIEQLPQHLSAGNVYEAGQLNLLSVLELMNHALLLLKEEQSRLPEACAPQLHPQHLQEKCLHMARGLKGLQLMRQKISKEEIPEVRGAIRKLEAEWDRKWMDTLKDTPLISFLNEDPALGFLSPMAPLSFEPATEAIYTSSVFSQYRAKLLGDENVTFLSPSVLDVKNSWRKAIEEDKAQKTHLSAKSDVDSIIECLTPLADVSLRPSAPSQSVSSDPTSAAHHSSPPVCQQGESHMSTLSWDCSNTEAPHSPSGTGSSAFHFSLHHETLPEMPGSDSLLSLSEEAADPSEEEEEEEDELLLPGIPSLKSETKQTLLTARQRLEQIQQACSDSSFMDNRKRSPDCLLSRHEAPSLDRNWLMAATMDAATSVAATEKVFSLDLDTLESPSPPNKQEYSLPKLVTFSPIDDM